MSFGFFSLQNLESALHFGSFFPGNEHQGDTGGFLHTIFGSRGAFDDSFFDEYRGGDRGHGGNSDGGHGGNGDGGNGDGGHGAHDDGGSTPGSGGGNPGSGGGNPGGGGGTPGGGSTL